MRWGALIPLLIAVSVRTDAQPIYPSTPDWQSADTEVSTGAALVDLDRDGWLDLLVSNGNDISQQNLAVYYNQGDGTYPPLPDWSSTDSLYNGHLDVADVNGDGWPDVAVATLGSFSTVGPIARIYLNNAGVLSNTPDWSASIWDNAFGVAFGDVNNDGRPDLAVATGWAYGTPHLTHNYVYMNTGGMLEPTPSWTSADTWDLQGALWVDADDDGWLDLVGCPARVETPIYRNNAGTLGTTPAWTTADAANQDGIMAAAGDVTGDGVRDLVLTDNDQLGGPYTRLYDGLPFGLFDPIRSWEFNAGYGSAVALADLDADGALDLALGAWWAPVRLFLNTGSGLPATATWTSSTSSVIEKIVFGDIDKNGLRTVTQSLPLTPQSRRLLYLDHQPVQEIVEVRRDGVVLLPDQYTFSREHGWITVEPPAGAVDVTYTTSSRLDMAVSNWDSSVGNYVFYNQLVLKGDANCDGRLNAADIDPFVLVLVDRPAYNAIWPDCDADTFCDMNDDGAVNAGDIDPFVSALTGS